MISMYRIDLEDRNKRALELVNDLKKFKNLAEKQRGLISAIMKPKFEEIVSSFARAHDACDAYNAYAPRVVAVALFCTKNWENLIKFINKNEGKINLQESLTSFFKDFKTYEDSSIFNDWDRNKFIFSRIPLSAILKYNASETFRQVVLFAPDIDQQLKLIPSQIDLGVLSHLTISWLILEGCPCPITGHHTLVHEFQEVKLLLCQEKTQLLLSAKIFDIIYSYLPWFTSVPFSFTQKYCLELEKTISSLKEKLIHVDEYVEYF
jgi:hypothetical protein